MSISSTGTARHYAASCAGATPRLAMIAAGIAGSKSDAEDIVQQAIMIAIGKDTEFESEAHFIGWLAGIVRHCALNYRRKSMRRNTYATDPSKLLSVAMTAERDCPVDQSTGELHALQRSFDDQVQLALAQIAPNARSCFLLRIVEELSYREISQLMNIAEGTAMNLVHRSKKKLRELLASDGVHQTR